MNSAASPATTHLLYLHGFRSSPQSMKAAKMAAWAAEQPGLTWWCPQLPPSPAEAMALVREGTRHWPAGRRAVMGSSLGGFYATALAGDGGWRAVLINPAVVCSLDPEMFIGTQTNLYTGESFEFTAEHIAQLRELELPAVTPERYLLLVETGDEVLDYRQAVARYAGCRQCVLDGGDHSFTRFPDLLPQLFEFCRL